ncbi:unnamed protein product [Amoebophrya sp. A25]|nr:unnamed protein product [Amoebophrya sp. A25]|eukprot:GSA25T00016126001.1
MLRRSLRRWRAGARALVHRGCPLPMPILLRIHVHRSISQRSLSNIREASTSTFACKSSCANASALGRTGMSSPPISNRRRSSSLPIFLPGKTRFASTASAAACAPSKSSKKSSVPLARMTKAPPSTSSSGSKTSAITKPSATINSKKSCSSSSEARAGVMRARSRTSEVMSNGSMIKRSAAPAASSRRTQQISTTSSTKISTAPRRLVPLTNTKSSPSRKVPLSADAPTPSSASTAPSVRKSPTAVSKGPVHLQFLGHTQYIDLESEADRVCERILKDKVRLIGIDAEWNMTFKKNAVQRVALLQLAYEIPKPNPRARASWAPALMRAHESLQRPIRVKLFHLSEFSRFPAALRKILEDDEILKVGVNIKGDCSRLVKEHKIEVSENKVAWVDTEKLARRKISLSKEPVEEGAEEMRNYTLASLCSYFYRISIDKTREIRCGNWERWPLTTLQQNYAATDAATHLSTYWALEKMEDLPESEQLRRTAVRRSGPSSTSSRPFDLIGMIRRIVDAPATTSSSSAGSSSGSTATTPPLSRSSTSPYNSKSSQSRSSSASSGEASSSNHSAREEQNSVILFRPRFPSAQATELRTRELDRFMRNETGSSLLRLEVPTCLDVTLPSSFFDTAPNCEQENVAESETVDEDQRPAPPDAEKENARETKVGVSASSLNQLVSSATSNYSSDREAAEEIAKKARRRRRVDLLSGEAVSIAEELDKFLRDRIEAPPVSGISTPETRKMAKDFIEQDGGTVLTGPPGPSRSSFASKSKSKRARTKKQELAASPTSSREKATQKALRGQDDHVSSSAANTKNVEEDSSLPVGAEENESDLPAWKRRRCAPPDWADTSSIASGRLISKEYSALVTGGQESGQDENSSDTNGVELPDPGGVRSKSVDTQAGDARATPLNFRDEGSTSVSSTSSSRGSKFRRKNATGFERTLSADLVAKPDASVDQRFFSDEAHTDPVTNLQYEMVEFPSLPAESNASDTLPIASSAASTRSSEGAKTADTAPKWHMCVPWTNPQKYAFVYVPTRIFGVTKLVGSSTWQESSNTGKLGAADTRTSGSPPAASPLKSTAQEEETVKSRKPISLHVELTHAMERVWLRVLQQGYTLDEVAKELNLKRITVISYLSRSLISGRHYIWGPHLGVSDLHLARILDALSASASTSSGNRNTIQAVRPVAATTTASKSKTEGTMSNTTETGIQAKESKQEQEHEKSSISTPASSLNRSATTTPKYGFVGTPTMTLEQLADEIELDTIRTSIAVLHLRRLVDAGTPAEISAVVPALCAAKLERYKWAIRKWKKFSVFSSSDYHYHAAGATTTRTAPKLKVVDEIEK